MKTALRKLAVDKNCEQYFEMYYMAYGAQLTRDLAKKETRIASRRVAALNWQDAQKEIGEPGSIANCWIDESGENGVVHVSSRPGDQGWGFTVTDLGGGIVEEDAYFADESAAKAAAEKWVTDNGKQASRKIADDISGVGQLHEENGVYVIDDPNYPLKSAPLIVTDQFMAQLIIMEGQGNAVPYKAIPFGKAEIKNPNMIASAHRANDWDQDDEEWFKKELEKSKGKQKESQTHEEDVKDSVDRAFNSGVQEIPNKWVLIAPSTYECDYEGGAHGAILYNQGAVEGVDSDVWSATCILTDGSVLEQGHGILGEAMRWVDEQVACEGCGPAEEQTTYLEMNQVAKAGTFLLKAQQEQDAIKQKVKDLWLKGKSISEIEDELGWVVHVDGSISEQSANILDGKFTIQESQSLESRQAQSDEPPAGWINRAGAWVKPVTGGRFALAYATQGGTPRKGEQVTVEVWDRGVSGEALGQSVVSFAQDSDLDNALEMISQSIGH